MYPTQEILRRLKLLEDQASGANVPETDHLIDHVTADAGVLALGRGAVVSIATDNTVTLAATGARQFPTAYGVYEGVPGIVRTTGIVPDVLVDAGLVGIAAGAMLYVGTTPGSLTNAAAPGTLPFAEVVDATNYATKGRVKAYVRPIMPPAPLGP